MTDVVVTGLGVALPSVDTPAKALTPREVPWPGWFDVAERLPGRGYKRLPPACQYLLAAVAGALTDADDPLAAIPAEDRGVIVGTNNAGTALLDEQDSVIISSGAEDLPPLTAPYFAMSLFASRLSTEHTIHGCNLTVNSPRTAGFDALQLAGRALSRGRARVVIVGATEETLPAAEPGSSDSDVGAVALICRAPGRSAGAANTAADHDSYGACHVRTTFLAPGSTPGDAFADAWNALVDNHSAPPVVEAVLDDSPIGAAVADWLAVRSPDLSVISAGAGCLTPLRQVTGYLAGGGPERIVVTAAAEGHVAITRVRPAPNRPASKRSR